MSAFARQRICSASSSPISAEESDTWREQLGVTPFERTSGGVRPTSAGRDFINGVRRILNDLQIVVDGAKAVKRGEAAFAAVRWDSGRHDRHRDRYGGGSVRLQSFDGLVERAHYALPEDHPLSANEIIYWTDLRPSAVDRLSVE